MNQTGFVNCVAGSVLTVALMLGVQACTEPKDAYTHIQKPSAPLLGDFQSYATPAQVRAVLPHHLPVTVFEDSEVPPDDPRPKFDVLELRIANYDHLGQRGELRLTFVNERLLSTWFYPDSYDSYLAALRISGVTPTSESTRVGEYTELWTTRDFEDRRYVAWEDIRLAEELKQWIMKYS